MAAPDRFSKLLKPIVTSPFRSWTNEEYLEAIQIIDEQGLTPIQQSAIVTALHILASKR